MLKSKKSLKGVRHVTKAMLVEIAAEGDRLDFNRQINPTVLDNVADERFQVEFGIWHHHRHGQPAERHVRAVVMLRMAGESEGTEVVIDMTEERFRSLPKAGIFPRKSPQVEASIAVR